ncbi:MAG: hypothetical protein V7629_15700 [Motiliproteus sp.]
MNASQRAEVVCKRVRLSTSGEECVEIQKALEQQGLDARQACAEAVGQVAGESGDDLIDAGSAQAACINSRVV